MNDNTSTFERCATDIESVRRALSDIVVGQDDVVRNLLIAMFAGGHVLLEGLPGLGKTHLAKSVAATIGVQAGRVQCTPDLLPADITGSEVMAADGRSIEFRRGPVFANLLLVDEINRATPRTQSALLEAMQERQVTYAGESHDLPSPFWVVATQNPIELEGTFPLPEAQLDRFLFKIDVAYPAADSMERLLQSSLDADPRDPAPQVLEQERVDDIMRTCRDVLISEPVRKAAVDLVLATQPHADVASDTAREHVRYGASPRALQSLVRAARVHAVMEGRVHLDYADLHAVARPALAHRLLLRTVSELDGMTVGRIIDAVLDEWQSRRKG